MHLTPSGAYEHIKESVIEYLETAYKIAHPMVFAERGETLRRRGVIAQVPFIEATPAFPTASKLVELERQHPEFLPAGLAELVQHGVPVDRFPLYIHQQEALLAAFGECPDLLVATGTGSGKTEAFLLPILADVLREAMSWPATDGAPQRGEYDAQADVWLHSRRHEVRPAGLRGIVLYPMNALVNDQLSRLRRILSRDTSPDWQRRNLRGNAIHFGMYTSLSRPTGNWTDKSRRDRFALYLANLVKEWHGLRPDLRDTGFWPRPDSPEMLCRWDIQMAPPDILVTNYSMLEYMLIRPIEDPIFESTRQWLHGTTNARFTLVLDEAHTYTGAKGTEVAYLVRRLKERLGVESGSSKFRAIATTASVPNAPGSDSALLAFTANLFGEPAGRFSLIRAVAASKHVPTRSPDPKSLNAFSRFHEGFDIQDPFPAIEQLASDLNLGHVDATEDPQVTLHDLIEKTEEVNWVRLRTARRATLLDQLSDECWKDLATPQEREQATSGVLAAGSFARPSASSDTPPLLSMRIHAFFRGVTGIWACTDPDCPEVPVHLRNHDTPRPTGKLYMDPRPWCSDRCGARVLELFSCRHCGLLFLGGIPDSKQASLWPWSDDLSGERQDISDFRIFGVERPHARARPDSRSTRTTLPIHPHDTYSRPTYEIEPAQENNQHVSNFPGQCPRCQRYRQPGTDSREVIEPLRTKGPRAFSAIVEDAFRVQPRARYGEPPNYGRKALIFTDSRQDAALLAADLRTYHGTDLFRQLLYRALYACQPCMGTGKVEHQSPYVIGQPQATEIVRCPGCGGTGIDPQPSALSFEELRSRTIGCQVQRGIDPTNDKISNYFARLEAGSLDCESLAKTAFHVALRREIAEDEFSLEPLGLASWRVQLPPHTGSFALLTDEETQVFLRSVARLLAMENVLLPPHPYQPWEWPPEIVKEYERCVMIQAYRRSGKAIPYNLQPKRRLGRYVSAVSHALVESGVIASKSAAAKWVGDLSDPLWNALKGLQVLEWAGAKIDGKVPYGIRIDRFELHPVGDTVWRCGACSYMMSETLLGVCIRCGQHSRPVPAGSSRNYYRRAAHSALPGSQMDDPYPLRAIEHTAQIPGTEARDLERWFQDLFHDHQNRHDHRIDILSVTTTMEMGIDIGSLLSVGLRNVPPTVANYQQRAGRAGRRGSSIATVLTFAQGRSHDQYYFARPPEIVSEPPRVPSLYLENEVIARRHFRSFVLQAFFRSVLQGQQGRGLFGNWGTVADFGNQQTASKFQRYLASNRAPLLDRLRGIIPLPLHEDVRVWMDALLTEVQDVVRRQESQTGLLEALINSGLLPKYAFPVDIVGLSIPRDYSKGDADDNHDADAMQRDLKIALTEYAPGAEVIRGTFPKTFIYRSAGIYDPFNQQPDYGPTGQMVECLDCQSIELLPLGHLAPAQCRECHSFHLEPLPYLRPPGFTVDAALPDAGRFAYEGGGRERAGYATSARLQVGETSFSNGRSHPPFAPGLYTHVRVGDLFTCNRGPDRDFPGFIICRVCGRAMDPENLGTHKYPADVPPHRGRTRGPRAGSRCPNQTEFQNQVLLGHRFHSEVILFGVELPDAMDAPFHEAAGKAAWYSFGTLLADAAARVLQIDPGELRVGVRAIRRGPGRIHGEVFLYDDVPGGAGYARAIERNLEEILSKALLLGKTCANPDCGSACYHCLYDYRNQMIHPLLGRSLGTAILEYILECRLPAMPDEQVRRCATGLVEFSRSTWSVLPGTQAGPHYFPCVLQDKAGQQYALWVIHPLQARPSAAQKQLILAQYGLRCAVHTSFDLERRPFWVFNNLLQD